LALARHHCPEARILYALADLHHLRLARQAAVEERPELAARSRQMRLAECTAAWMADAVLTHSPAEAAWLRQAVPEAEVHVVPWHVPPRPVATPFAQRRGVGFLGGYAHAPNVDAAVWLVEAIMPLVWRSDPTIPCLLAGTGMPDRVRRLARPGVEVLGEVADPDALFGRVRVMTAPLRFGAGIKGKVLAGFAAGLPCVMTGVAAEGLGLSPPLRGDVADTAEAFAARILALHGDAAAATRAGVAGLALVRAGFSAARVEAALREAVTPRPAALRAVG
ncbi:MAG TPA: glycosyltransferase family 4 protein, partial [Acetobacteraceae bacterium]|nr:glycosyltransferase family 4 protein [Acetobacteraceae bacterium]